MAGGEAEGSGPREALGAARLSGQSAELGIYEAGDASRPRSSSGYIKNEIEKQGNAKSPRRTPAQRYGQDGANSQLQR